MNAALPGLAPAIARPAEAQAAVDRLGQRIGEVSTLPSVVLRIIEVVNDDSTGADDLLRVISGDPALAVRILRTVNSASFALRRRVDDLRSAVALLGFREIRNLALTVHVARVFREGEGHGPYRREQLWNHLVSVASAARLVARITGRGDPDNAYLGGLLHDLGLILIDQHMHQRFCTIIDQLDESTPTIEIEQRLLGLDHTEIGANVAAHWRLPEVVQICARFHHAPEQHEGEHAAELRCVALANYMCSRSGLPSLGVQNVPAPSAETFAGLGVAKQGLAAICDQLEKALDVAASIAGN